MPKVGLYASPAVVDPWGPKTASGVRGNPTSQSVLMKAMSSPNAATILSRVHSMERQVTMTWHMLTVGGSLPLFRFQHCWEDQRWGGVAQKPLQRQRAEVSILFWQRCEFKWTLWVTIKVQVDDSQTVASNFFLSVSSYLPPGSLLHSCRSSSCCCLGLQALILVFGFYIVVKSCSLSQPAGITSETPKT